MAQLPAPNSMGVGMGHLHLSTTDPAAQKKFWVDTLGGTIGKLGQSEIAHLDLPVQHPQAARA